MGTTSESKTAGLRWAAGLTAGLGLALQLAGCGGAPPPPPKSGGDLIGESKPGADQIIPKEKKRDLTADQKADFAAAMERYQAAKKSGGLSASECSSVSEAFRAAADANPNVPEARFNQGAVLQECGREAEAVRIWEGMTEGKSKYGPAMTNLGYVAWKNGDMGRAESLFTKAIDADPLHTVEARNNLAQILRDKARKASTPEEKRQYVNQAVSNLRTVLALDSNNLQAFSTLSFIYFDLGMLEMAKLVGNQAIRKADEIATGKFEEEKAEDNAAARASKSGKKAKQKDKEKKDEEDKDSATGLAHAVDVREVGTGVTPQMKVQLAVVHNTLGLVELRKRNISPAISQFRQAVELNPAFNEARLNLAALSLNNRDYKTAEENFQAVIQAQPKNYEAMIGLGVALRGNKKIDDAEAQYIAAQKLDPQNPSSYFNLGLLYQDYKDGQKPALQKAQDYYRQFLGKANGSTPDGLRRDAEKRIKDIDEIYVALAEAAKLQAEADEMQRKAEEQQKQMEEQMKKQQADEAAAAGKAGEKPAESAATSPPPADGSAAPAAATPDATAPAAGGKKKKKK
ncbi:MAG TPA: tetratricopeptide repeat protein [Polyangia bacterium]